MVASVILLLRDKMARWKSGERRRGTAGEEGKASQRAGKGREEDRGRCWIVMHVKGGGEASSGSGERGRRMSLRSVESVKTGEQSRDL